MYTIGIISTDDERKSCLTDYLSRYSANTGLDISLSSFTSCRQLNMNDSSGFDIIFSDVQFAEKDYIGLRQNNENAVIILLAGENENVINAIDGKNYSFILKPLDFYNFSCEFDGVMQKIQSGDSGFLFIRLKGGIVRVALKDIFYIECKNHTLIFHTVGGEYRRTGVIGDLEKRLQNSGFKRCFKGTLVNLSKVEEVTLGCVTVGGSKLKISRIRRKEFLNALNKYSEIIK